MKSVIRTFLIVFLLQLLVIPFFNGSANAMYSTRSERLFREAAKQYWQAHDWDSSKYCSPYEVEIIYGTFAPGYYAKVAQVGDGNRAFKGDPYYCKTWFNTRYKETRAGACLTFIHEFGHLMDRVHNDNLNSPMYVGYAEPGTTPSRSKLLFERNQKRILSRSLCNALDIRG